MVAADLLGAEQEAAADDAIGDVDLVGVGRDLQPIHGVQDEADAVVVRLLGLERPEPGHLGRRRVRRQLHLGEARRHVGAGVELLGERRRAEARADGAADGDHRAEVVARGELADRGVAEVGEVRVAPGDVEVQVVQRVAGEVDVDRFVGARVVAGVGRAIAGEGLGAARRSRTRARRQ